MLEFLVVVGLIFLAGAMFIGLLKFLFWLVVLPLKLGWWVVKGAVGLVLLIPAAIVAAWAVSSVLPLVLAVVAIPVLVLVFVAFAVVNAVF
ncbi:MAG: hypothetical protein ACE5EO_00190 [Candidatus Krumholzibacteriia bacterium]